MRWIETHFKAVKYWVQLKMLMWDVKQIERKMIRKEVS